MYISNILIKSTISIIIGILLGLVLLYLSFKIINDKLINIDNSICQTIMIITCVLLTSIHKFVIIQENKQKFKIL